MAILRTTILGCGSSGGVPRVGGADGRGNWGACDPGNPKNRRRRCAVLVERIENGGTTRILIDAGADVREQLLGAEVGALDAVLITHEHADHVHGLDDLRPIVLSNRRRLDVWTDEETAAMLADRFSYAFVQPEGSNYPPIFNLLTHDGRLAVEGAGGAIEASAHRVEHGPNTFARGFRIGGMAYTPDVSDIPAGEWAALEGLDLWIVDALRWTPHVSHAHVERTLEWIDRVKPKRAVLTNLHIDLDYAELAAFTPAHVEPAYDGLVLEIAL